ncbi:MAG TPA: hypothetical protein VFQ67_14755 [Allosphingosinicella sp.]|jgi:hypothetical protein|nr:hypothetical protein [Allosphingosinicella sp.]
MKLKLTILALAALAAASAAAADPPEPRGTACTRAAVGSAAIALRAARAELMAAAPRDDDTLVDPETGRRIEATKDRLRAFVRAMMDCAPTGIEPTALAASMAQRAGTDDPEPGLADRHGGLIAYQASRVEGHPDMIAVVATVGIRCGSDSMLLLYAREGTLWRELMVRRSEPYAKISGGWGDLRFAVSPPDAQGKWFVATVSTTPWCTSAWQGLPYELARPGPSPDRPSVFFRGKGTIYLGDEDDLVVRAERDAFELRHDGSSLDSDILIRRHVRRYAVAGESVRRVQPVAGSVRDFVDEWISSPWAEARAWSGPDPALAAAHKALQEARYETLRGFDSVRACSGDANEVQLDDLNGPNWFLVVRGGPEGPWTLERAARRPAKQCLGADGLPR